MDVTLAPEDYLRIAAHKTVLKNMAPLGAGGGHVLINKVLGIIHFHWMQMPKPDLETLIVDKFRIEELCEARNMLGDFIDKKKLPKDWPESRRTSKKYFKDIHDIFSNADFDVEELQVFVSSVDLKFLSTLVSVPGEAVDPSEVVPVSTRLGQLEGMVKNLTEGFRDFKTDSEKRWNMEQEQKRKGEEAGGRAGAGGREGARGRNASYSAAVRTGSQMNVALPIGHWDRHQQEQGVRKEVRQDQGRIVIQQEGQLPGQQKRQGQEQVLDGGEAGEWQPASNRYRNKKKINYGTGNVMSGAEAAPVVIHIGNINPNATEVKVKEAILQCANNMSEKPGDLKEEELHVEPVRRKDDDPNPRTRAWKVTVPNLWREQALNKSDFYPRGWSHRQWFERRNLRREQPGRTGWRQAAVGGPGAGGPEAGGPVSGGPAAGGPAAGGPAAGVPVISEPMRNVDM